MLEKRLHDEHEQIDETLYLTLSQQHDEDDDDHEVKQVQQDDVGVGQGIV